MNCWRCILQHRISEAVFSVGGKWGNLHYYGLRIHINGGGQPSVIQTARNQQIHRALGRRWPAPDSLIKRTAFTPY